MNQPDKQPDQAGQDVHDPEKVAADTTTVQPGYDSLTGRDTQVSLVEVLAYADAHYIDNDVVAEGYKTSPRQAILGQGPLRYFFGPPTPPTINNAHVAAEKGKGGVTAQLQDEEAGDLTSRHALRKVTTLGAFFLITTDVLGPQNSGFVFSQVGYVPGVLCYVSLGILAWYAGNLLTVLYLRLDSDKYPIRSYGDIVLRLLGSRARIVSDALLMLQLVTNCGGIMLGAAQSLSQIIEGANGRLCFIVAIVIMLLIQLLLSPIRSLRSVGFFANAAVFLNIALIFITIGFISTSPPNYSAAKKSFGVDEGPVVTAAVESRPLEERVNGIMNIIYAYGGAMIFVDFLGEMKRPWDFWKAMSYAQGLILMCYTGFGITIYGQFTESQAYYGVSLYRQQTVGNVIAIILCLICALLYGNIAQKLCYHTAVVRWCKGPSLMPATPRSILLWLIVNLVFWSIAFIVAAAIPQLQTVAGLVAAVCILQFSYTLPFLLKVALDVQIIAMRADPIHTLSSSPPQQKDSWFTISRWSRGLFGGSARECLINGAHILLFLGSLAMAIIGAYGSGTAIKTAFTKGAATSFGCSAPA